MGILSMGLSMATQVAEFGAKEQEAAAQDQRWRQNYVQSLAAGRDEQVGFQMRELQEQDALDQKLRLSELEQARAEGSANVAAADQNISGASVDGILREIGSSAAYNREVERTNYQWTAVQLQQEKKQSFAKQVDRIQGMPKGNHPSAGGLILGLAGSVIGGM